MADSPDSQLPGPTPTGYKRSTGGAGFRWVPPTPEHLAKLLPQYEIESLAGRGGMGAVYRGKQRALDRTVAIKILPPEVDDDDANYTDRFKNEAKIMAKLEHPAIVPVYDFGETSEGQLYFVMSFINGTDVQQMVQQQGRLPPEHALAISAHVCDALQYAHAHGVVHRDIKPSNVLINMDGQVKVADFGLAKLDDPSQSSGLTKTGLAMGTPDYVAPEALVLGAQVDGRADLYAVGVMLYQMLTGQVPRGMFSMPTALLPGLDPRFDAIIAKAMKTDPNERYATAADLRRDLDVILTTPLVKAGGQASAAIPMQSLPKKPVAKGPQQKPAAPKPTAAPAPPPAKSKTPLFIGAGAVAAVGLGAFFLMGGKPEPVQPLAPSVSTVSVPKPESQSKADAPAVAADKPQAQSTGDKFPIGKWVKWFTADAKLPSDFHKAYPEARFDNGWFRSPERKQVNIPFTGPVSNLAVRVHFLRKAPSGEAASAGSFGISLRSGKSRYQLKPLDTEMLCLRFNDSAVSDSRPVFRSRLPQPVELNKNVTVLFAVVGKHLIARGDGDFFQYAADEPLPPGGAYISGMDDFGDIEVMNLDGMPEKDALKLLDVGPEGTDLRKKNESTPLTYSGASKPAASYPPGKWVKIYTTTEELPDDLRKSNGGTTVQDGWIRFGDVKGRVWMPDALHGNYGIRATMRRGETSDAFSRLATHRVRDSTTAPYYQIGLNANASAIVLQKSVDSKTYESIDVTSVPQVPSNTEYRFELSVVGNRIMAGDGTRILKSWEVRDLLSGQGQIFGGEPIRDLEVINLDGIPEAEALKILGVDEKGKDLEAAPVAAAAPAAKFPPGQWVKVYSTFEELPGSLRKPGSGVIIEDGWIRLSTSNGPSKNLDLPGELQGNYAVRYQCQHNNSFDQPEGFVMRRTPGMGRYQVKLAHKQLQAQRQDADRYTTLFDSRFSTSEANQNILVEVAVVGDRIIARQDGKLARMVTDTHYPRGQSYINTAEPIHDIEVINLDGLSEAEALKVLGTDEKGNDLLALASAQKQKDDSIAAIPELKTLHDAFTKLTADRVTGPFEADLTKLNTGYLGGIDRKIADERKIGHLDGVLALEAEKKLIAEQKTLPAEDDEQTSETLKGLRKIYRDAYAKLDAARAANLKTLTDPLSVRLKQLESTLTQQNRIPDAKAVREYREHLDAAAPAPAASAATTGKSEASTNTATAKFAKGDDRKAAEWAIDLGGWIRIAEGKNLRRIETKDDLPKHAFELQAISIAPNRATKPAIEFAGLGPIAGLRHLAYLEVNDYPVADSDTDYLASLPELTTLLIVHSPHFTGSQLAKLKASKLHLMNFGYTAISAQALERLSECMNLDEIYLGGTDIGDNDVAPLLRLKKLKTLHLAKTKVTIEGWRKLKGLQPQHISFDVAPGATAAIAKDMAGLFPLTKTITLASAQDAITADDVASLAAFPLIQDIRINSTSQDDAFLEGLARLPKLQAVWLSGGSEGANQKMTDEGMAKLAPLKSLAKVHLESIHNFTSGAIMSLAKTKSLKTLEIRSCIAIDDAAIAAFKKARPDVSVSVAK